MKDCENYLNDIYDFADSDISQERLAQLNTHLEMCEDCRKKLEQVKCMKSSFEQLAVIEAPQTLTSSVMDKLSSKNKFKQVYRFAGIAAAVVICVALYSTGVFNQDEKLLGSGESFSTVTSFDTAQDNEDTQLKTRNTADCESELADVDDEYVEYAKSTLTQEQLERVEGLRTVSTVDGDNVTVTFYGEDESVVLKIEYDLSKID